MNEIYKEFLLSFITLIVTGLGTFLIKLISLKMKTLASKTADESKRHFLDWVENDIIIKCINTTTQTYVQKLKDSNKFDKEAQKEALNKTISEVTKLLTERNTELLSTYVGDITSWITICVENYILESKNEG